LNDHFGRLVELAKRDRTLSEHHSIEEAEGRHHEKYGGGKGRRRD
jgi:hypothetical protein